MEINVTDIPKFLTLEQVRDFLEIYQADEDHEDDILEAFNALDKALRTIRNRVYSPEQQQYHSEQENWRAK